MALFQRRKISSSHKNMVSHAAQLPMSHENDFRTLRNSQWVVKMAFARCETPNQSWKWLSHAAKLPINRKNIVSQVAQLPTNRGNGVGLHCHPERSEGSPTFWYSSLRSETKFGEANDSGKFSISISTVLGSGCACGRRSLASPSSHFWPSKYLWTLWAHRCIAFVLSDHR